jgi:hypothetical protein
MNLGLAGKLMLKMDGIYENAIGNAAMEEEEVNT